MENTQNVWNKNEKNRKIAKKHNFKLMPFYWTYGNFVQNLGTQMITNVKLRN